MDYANEDMDSQPSRNIFGVRINDDNTLSLYARIVSFLEEHEGCTIATPNPEILVHAWKHAHFVDTLNAHDLLIGDGAGLQYVAHLKYRTTGADLADHLMQFCAQKGLRVALITRFNGRSTPGQIIDIASHRYPGAHIRVFSASLEQASSQDFHEELVEFHPHLVLVGLGFPVQEEWVNEHGRAWLPQSVLLSVGGTFDYWTGVAARAPRWMQKTGIEWLWRLIQHPKRIGRILNAVVVFPVIYFFSKKDEQ